MRFGGSEVRGLSKQKFPASIPRQSICFGTPPMLVAPVPFSESNCQSSFRELFAKLTNPASAKIAKGGRPFFCCYGTREFSRESRSDPVTNTIQHDTRYTIHDTRYTIHDTRYTVHGTRYTIHDMYSMNTT
jgi:hypothetical protein